MVSFRANYVLQVRLSCPVCVARTDQIRLCVTDLEFFDLCKARLGAEQLVIFCYSLFTVSELITKICLAVYVWKQAFF